jgi:hypothetical protein
VFLICLNLVTDEELEVSIFSSSMLLSRDTEEKKGTSLSYYGFRTKGLTSLTSETDCDQTTISLSCLKIIQIAR